MYQLDEHRWIKKDCMTISCRILPEETIQKLNSFKELSINISIVETILKELTLFRLFMKTIE